MAGVPEGRLERYRPLAYAIARQYYFPGGDDDDVRQEAMVALVSANASYRPELGAFKPFATAVIHRRLSSALKTATRHKHRVLSEAQRFESAARPIDRSWELDPATVLEAKEEALELLRRVREDLTPLQRHCLIAYANGKSHMEIAEEVGGTQTFNSAGRKRYPRVYNALGKARRKLAA